MAFLGEKLGSMMQRPQDENKDDVPWWMKYAGRGLGTVGGGIAIFLGIWNCVGIMLGQVDCLLAGIWQMLAGFITIVIEAPCCCMFVDFVQNFSDWAERRPYWNRAAFYCGIAIPAILFCFSLSSLFGSGLIFATGVVYGMMALGRKATQDEMRAAAAATAAASSSGAPVPPSTATSVNMKAELVSNAQPMAADNPPPYPGV